MRFFWIFYFCSTLLFAQQSQWRSITTADGLSHGTVFDLLQDQEGYVWMATKAGLNRYDGDNFKVFTTHTTPSYAITSNQTTALYEDHHHRLWIGTESGELNLFDLQTQRFYHCFLTNKKNILPAVRQHIYCISEDSRGDLWVGTLTGEIYKVSLPNDLKKGGFPDKEDFSDCVEVAFLNTNLASTMRVNFIKLLKNKQLVVGTQAGFGRIDYINHQYIPIKIEPIGTGRFLNIYEAPDGRFILTQPTQVLAYKGNKITVLYSKSNLNNLPSQIRIDDLGNVFILENRKLFKAHYTQLTPDITTMPPIYQSDNFTLFSGLKSDCNGSAWINTGGYGLLKETRGPQQFKHYFKGRSIWVGFQDTYNRWVINNFKAFYLATSTDAQNLPPAPTYIDTHAMIEDGKGGYWQLQNDASNFSKMFLKRLQKDLRVVEEYPLEGQGVGENLGRLYKDKQGNLLITGLGSSIIKFDTLQKRVGYYSYEKIVPANVKVYSAYCDGQGTWWLGTQNGLLQAVSHFKGGYQFRLLKHHSKYTTTLSENQVSMMVDDPYKPATYLWVGTLGGGLNRMNKTNGTFEHFTVNDGLPDDYIVGILADDNKNLWLSTYHGLVQFNPRTFVSAIFTSKDGLQADEFAVASCFKTNRGELAFGGVNGLTVFSPAALQRTKASQLPKINQLKINNQEVMPGDETEILAQSIEQTSSIQLAHDQNQVTLSFSLIDLENAPKNRFRYQLLGIDKKRIEAGTTHSVTYSQLPSGSYTFQLTGSADGSQWSAPVEFKITVNPPLYRTWWAYLCYLSLVSLIVYRLYLAQLNRVRLQEQLLYKNKEAERLGELDAIKTNFFANISHEFRTPLTLILGPMEQIIQEYEADVRFPVIQRNASRLLTLINQLLDISKLEAGQMAPEITSTELVRYFRTLTGSFVSLAESRRVRLEVSQNQDEVHGFVDEDKVEKIVTNLLSNALKFTEAGGKVTVGVQYISSIGGKEEAMITVSDTGIGIKPAQLDKIFNRFYQVEADRKRGYEGTGIGLALVKELVEVLKGTIVVESAENVGTTFRVKLPIDEATWKDYLTEQPSGIQQKLQENVLDYSSLLPLVEEPSIDKKRNQLAAEEEGEVLLIIDDNADIRAYVRSIFEKEYQVLEAADGREGLDLAIETLPNIVICDLMMPRMDGFEFCRHLKSDERSSHIPVVMLTAKATLEDRIEGFELGADEYLTKPFHKTELQSRVKNLLQKQEKLRHYFSSKTLEAKPTKLKPTEVKASTVDELFLQKVKAVLEANLSNSAFGVVEFSTAMSMSKSQLNRKLNALCDCSSNELIRAFRLQRAADLLRAKAGTVSDIAYQVGFEHLSYFSKSFQEKFGTLPSEYF
ncbi:MAG TPA: hybrid sensor histidine kinase/response regulator [Runella sp.]|nr:hybrid sensor histidine kinase/response regulator [Runella sp.]